MVPIGPGGRSRARGDVQLAEDIADVAIDGLLAEEELAGNGLIGLAGRNEAEHLELSRAQPVRVKWGSGSRGRRRRGHRIGRAHVGCRAKLVEHLSRGVELEGCAVLVAERAKRARQ